MSKKRHNDDGALGNGTLAVEETFVVEHDNETVEALGEEAADVPANVPDRPPEEVAITAELLKRKPRKKRDDAGKQRKRKVTSGLEEESEGIAGEELETVCKTIAEVATGGLMSLSIAFARSRNNANLVLSEQDASNFNVAFKFIAKKYASVISESPEMYLLGIAVLGYAGRVTASDSVDFMAREA